VTDFDYALRPPATPSRELGSRHALRDGRPVAVLRAVADGSGARVEALVYPVGLHQPDPVRPGPYLFTDEREAVSFLNEAADALAVLGCSVERG
jgi:hypothetical protein